MKKIIALILTVGAFSCLLAGCGEDSSSKTETTSSSDTSASLVTSSQTDDEETTMLDMEDGAVTDTDGIIGNEDEETTALP